MQNYYTGKLQHKYGNKDQLVFIAKFFPTTKEIRWILVFFLFTTIFLINEIVYCHFLQRAIKCNLDENRYWARNLLFQLIILHSNMTSFFRFVNKRASYPFGIISLAHAPVNVTDFSIGESYRHIKTRNAQMEMGRPI
jgi:hypothetical protein